jgi:hypothetical protein
MSHAEGEAAGIEVEKSAGHEDHPEHADAEELERAHQRRRVRRYGHGLTTTEEEP